MLRPNPSRLSCVAGLGGRGSWVFETPKDGTEVRSPARFTGKLPLPCGAELLLIRYRGRSSPGAPRLRPFRYRPPLNPKWVVRRRRDPKNDRIGNSAAAADGNRQQAEMNGRFRCPSIENGDDNKLRQRTRFRHLQLFRRSFVDEAVGSMEDDFGSAAVEQIRLRGSRDSGCRAVAVDDLWGGERGRR